MNKLEFRRNETSQYGPYFMNNGILNICLWRTLPISKSSLTQRDYKHLS